MSWLEILLLIIKYGPALWALVKEIIDLIRGLKAHEQPALHEELRTCVRTLVQLVTQIADSRAAA